jgi:hypothetical protein
MYFGLQSDPKFAGDWKQAIKAASMDVDIAAWLPKLKKQGKLHALRHISALGGITCEMRVSRVTAAAVIAVRDRRGATRLSRSASIS